MNNDEVGFSIDICRVCSREGVVLGSKCKDCLMAGIADSVSISTFIALERAYETATARLMSEVTG